ncbi:MAG: metallophosphoesterase family protein [Rhodoferax sp.]
MSAPVGTRLAVLSDIHGNLPALQAVVADLRSRGITQVVNLGDSLSGPLWPLETAHYLMQQDWLHLAGNHERQLLRTPPERMGPSDAYAHRQLDARSLDWLRTQPSTHWWADDVLLCHGTPLHDHHYWLEDVTAGQVHPASATTVAERLGPVQASLVACGHTHVPRWVCTTGGTRVLNPGSVGLPAYDDAHPEPHGVQTGAPDARYAIVERSAAGWMAQLCCVPYDHEAAAQRAQANGREDWARALRTGYVA